MNLSVSFIVPCYCIEKVLLLRCLKSIVALGSDFDWEIQLVDDGTPQSQVAEWVDELGYNRIHYHYQENAGLGEARNTGIRYATKQYVQFVDSDDYLFIDSYRNVLKMLCEYSCPDLLIFGMKKVSLEEMEQFAARIKGVSVYESGAEYLSQNSLFAAACSYIVKRDVVDGKRFVQRILHEDEEFTPRLLLDCGRMLVARDLEAYAYYQRPDSIIGRKDAGHLARRFGDLLTVIGSLRGSLAGLDGLKRRALSRRIDQLGEAFVYELIRLSPSREFLDSWLDRLEREGVYPIAYNTYNFKYRVFYHLTDKRWKVRTLYKINKLTGCL